MRYILKNARVFRNGSLSQEDILVDGEIVSAVEKNLSTHTVQKVFDLPGCVITPGLIDVHVHLREPGFSYKETIKSGTGAAARGGFTTVFSMPNLSPVPDCPENLSEQLSIIRRDALIKVLPYGAISVGERGESLSDMEGLSPFVPAFSDDGKGVQNPRLMREAMLRAKALGKVICAHCEDNSLLNAGYIHDGDYARLHGHAGISSESEYAQIARDLKLLEETRADYHVCHISTAQSVELIRAAKKKGLGVTCETAPHYIAFTQDDLKEEGRFKMNPPLRDKADRDALIEGIKDGTVDMIATDHAPHSAEEKSRGLEKSAMGVVGLETSFAASYTFLVKSGIISFSRLMELMVFGPARRFSLEAGIEPGKRADLAVFDLEKSAVTDPSAFASLGRSTPFEGVSLFGITRMTVSDGKIVYSAKG